MDVLHVITGLNVGGAEGMLCRLLERRDAAPDIRPVVASLMPPGFAQARIVRAGVPVVDLRMRSPASAPGAALRLARLVRARRPDCIMAWMHHAQLAATLAVAGARTDTPVVWNVRHSLGGFAREKPLTRAVLRAQAALSAWPAAILYNAHDAARHYRALGFRHPRQVVIPNGFACPPAEPHAVAAARLRAAFGIPAGQFVIATVARAHPMKDVPGLLAAFATATAKGLHGHLLLVGEGMDRPAARIAAALARLPAGSVTLAGHRADVGRWLGGVDLLVLPSAWGEGFPNIVGEAMARGVPCLVTDVGDAARIVGDTGRAVPPGDAGALADAMLDMVALGAAGRARLGDAARARIAADFDMYDVARRYAALLRDVVAGGMAKGAAGAPVAPAPQMGAAS